MYREREFDPEPVREYKWAPPVPIELWNLYEEWEINEKEFFLLMAIDSYSGGKKLRDGLKADCGCFASNAFLAKKIQMHHPMTVSKLISKLKRMELIVEEYHDRKRYLWTIWTYNLQQTFKKVRKRLRSQTA